MAQTNLLFTWKPESFDAALKQPNLVDLRTELTKRRGISGSLLISKAKATNKVWWLVDYESKKVYHFDENSDTEVAVSEEEDDSLSLPKPSLSEEVYATSKGFIDWLKSFGPEESDLEELKRTDLSKYNLDFEIVHDDLLAAYKLLREIFTSPTEWLIGLSNNNIQQIRTCLAEWSEIISAIWDIHSSTSEDIRNETLRQIFLFCDRIKGQLGPTVAYLKAKKAEQLDPQTVDQLETQVNNIADKVLEDFKKENNLSHESTKQDLAKTQEELEQLTIRVENERAQESVSEFKEIFAEQAKRHQRAAWGWLGTTGVLIAGVVVGILFWGLLDVLKLEEAEWRVVLQNIFKNGSVLTLFYFALNRSIKNYAAQKHLEIVNRHRENALGTFERFVSEAKESRETRDAVLLAATNAIFDANQSGYLSVKTKGSNSANPIQQVVRTAFPGSSTKSED